MPAIPIQDLWADREDNILLANEGNNLSRKLAANGSKGFRGIPAPLEARLNGPHGVITHPHSDNI